MHLADIKLHIYFNYNVHNIFKLKIKNLKMYCSCSSLSLLMRFNSLSFHASYSFSSFSSSVFTSFKHGSESALFVFAKACSLRISSSTIYQKSNIILNYKHNRNS